MIVIVNMYRKYNQTTNILNLRQIFDILSLFFFAVEDQCTKIAKGLANKVCKSLILKLN